MHEVNNHISNVSAFQGDRLKEFHCLRSTDSNVQ